MTCLSSARTLQGMARVRSGRAPAWPLVSGRSGRRGSGVKRDFACTFTRHFSPVLVAQRSQSRLMLEGRTRTLSGPSPDLTSSVSRSSRLLGVPAQSQVSGPTVVHVVNCDSLSGPSDRAWIGHDVRRPYSPALRVRSRSEATVPSPRPRRSARVLISVTTSGSLACTERKSATAVRITSALDVPSRNASAVTTSCSAAVSLTLTCSDLDSAWPATRCHRRPLRSTQYRVAPARKRR